MIRTLAVAATLVTLALPGAASAQTYGQPVYLNAYGRPIGGTPLSEVETRSYAGTGRWADGYSDQPYVHVPTPAYGQGYGRYGYGDSRYRRGYDPGFRRHGHHRHDPPSRPGYRDEWGYNDDRPPSSRRWSDDGRSRRHDRDCGCSDVYPYDR